MRTRTYPDARSFLDDTQTALESNEPANGLLLGVCARLVRYPERITTPPCFKTVTDENGLVLAAMLTPPYNLVVYGHQGDLDQAARLLAAELVHAGWQIPGVFGPAGATKPVAEQLGRAGGPEYRLGWRQWLCVLREVQTPIPQRGRLRQATEADADLVGRWWYECYLELLGKGNVEDARQAARWRIEDGDVFLWDDGQPVSMANKTRPTRTGISIGPVYTPREMRGRGYATACVGELSRLLLAAGHEFVSLSVDHRNLVAYRVYERIGYRPICDLHEYAPVDG